MIYLEGHDQHRGWFQSSLLTSVALTEHAPYDTVLTHGFVVDGRRPQDVEVARQHDRAAGPPQDGRRRRHPPLGRLARLHERRPALEGDPPRTSEAYRKIRNTARFLISNLFDFDPAKDAVPDARLEPLERWALDAAARFAADVRAAYGRYEFHAVVRPLLDFVTVDLSAFWCDVRKDAFYVLAPNDPVRRSAQTAAWKIVEALALALSPVCPFTAEEIFESLPGNAADPSALFLKSWGDLKMSEISSSEREAWGSSSRFGRSSSSHSSRCAARTRWAPRTGRAVVGRATGLDGHSPLFTFQKKIFRTSSGLRPSCATPAPMPSSRAPPKAPSARAAGRCERTSNPARTASAPAAARSSAVRILR